MIQATGVSTRPVQGQATALLVIDVQQGLFRPAPSAIQAFEPELAAYPRSKGAIRFPIGQPLPLDLISSIVKFRFAENLKNAELKSRKRK